MPCRSFLFLMLRSRSRPTAAAQGRVTGPITLILDAHETPRKLLHATLTIPVTPGALTLVYPKWLPGEHAPDGPIDDMVGLTFSAGGKPVAIAIDGACMGGGFEIALACDIIIAAEIIFVVIIGLMAARKVERTTEGYFLASGSMPWWLIGAAFVSTSVSSLLRRAAAVVCDG